MNAQRRAGRGALAVVIVATLLVRLWAIEHFPEPDTDAAGHLGIARALLAHPMSVAVHWVYLPAYHYVLAILEGVGLGATGIRVVNCVLAAALPALVLRYVRDTGAGERLGVMAALLCAIAPLVNLLGTSGQQETLFTILVLGTAWGIDTDRPRRAGALLAFAVLVRYEAWGALALLVAVQIAQRIPRVAKIVPGARLPWVVTWPAVCAVGAWFVAHRLSDGQWLGFLHELYRYAHRQRTTFDRGPLWFAYRQPLSVFGWVVLGLFVVGFRRAWRVGWVAPIGIYIFLEAAYSFRGALGSARYYESLTPFVAIAAAHGIRALGARRRWLARLAFAVAFSRLLVLSSRFCGWSTSLRRAPAAGAQAAATSRRPKA